MRHAQQLNQYYTVAGKQRFGKQIHELIRFRILKMSKARRRNIFETMIEENDAQGLIECFWTRGSIIQKDMWSFDAIPIIDQKETKRRLVSNGC